jgi:hypothetical protein
MFRVPPVPIRRFGSFNRIFELFVGQRGQVLSVIDDLTDNRSPRFRIPEKFGFADD